jgi:hypothetical protein
MGELAGRVLLARIAGDPSPPLTPLPAPLAIRATTASPPQHTDGSAGKTTNPAPSL